MSFLRSIANVDEAWTVLRGVLRHLGGGAGVAETAHDDAALADFVRQHPGALESCFLTRTAELAGRAPMEGHRNLLGVLIARTLPNLELRGMGVTPDPEPLELTIEALEPSEMLRWVALTRADHADHLDTGLLHRLTGGFGQLFAERAPDALDRAGFPPSVRDCLRSRIHDLPPPDALPERVHSLSVEDIETRLADFAQCSTAALHKRLRPDGWSRSGFLGAEDHLGDVIRQDALALQHLGVDRHSLATRLEALLFLEMHADLTQSLAPDGVAMDDDVRRQRMAQRDVVAARVAAEFGPAPSPEGWPDLPWRVECRQYLGFQVDPFLPGDFAIGSRFASKDFEIERVDTGGRLAGPGCIVQLIRRACFFEGHVPYRVDPMRAVEVLSLGSHPL